MVDSAVAAVPARLTLAPATPTPPQPRNQPSVESAGSAHEGEAHGGVHPVVLCETQRAAEVDLDQGPRDGEPLPGRSGRRRRPLAVVADGERDERAVALERDVRVSAT